MVEDEALRIQLAISKKSELIAEKLLRWFEKRVALKKANNDREIILEIENRHEVNLDKFTQINANA